MFFIDNMSMYLQMDVVESRFRALMTAIGSCEDFLVIQREHNHFQIMVLSHCFLLTSASDQPTTTGLDQSEKSQQNEILIILEKILSVITVFAQSQLETESILGGQVPGMNSVKGLSDQFESLMGQLMLRLMGMKSGLYSGFF